MPIKQFFDIERKYTTFIETEENTINTIYSIAEITKILESNIDLSRKYHVVLRLTNANKCT